ncbi:tetraspanin-7-like [Contarinia nasturtii]|uniref:tetraspanin-7-like n=1 Tax=Contarinia nasturtii TaxID=265458 RepID=UPI0012D4038B|nr:tetraspanin-7-like [Contarinia nasturtii]
MGKFFQTVDSMACLKSLLMVFNMAFWASGLAIFCAGIWMQVELHKYLELNVEYSNVTPYILVGTGAFILLVSSLAFACTVTVKGNPSLLYIFGGFLAFILFIELCIAASIYAYKDRLADGFDKGLTNSMLSNSVDDPQRTIDFNWMQRNLKCCGNHGYDDWNSLLPRAMPIPKSCCKKRNCDAQDETQIYTEGCYDKVSELIESNMRCILAAALLVSLFPIVGILLTCSMAGNITKTKYEQMA